MHIVPVEVQSKEGFYLKYEKRIPLTIYFKTLLLFKKVLHTIKHKTVLNNYEVDIKDKVCLKIDTKHKW